MTRKEFIRLSTLLGIGMPFLGTTTSCTKNDLIAPFEVNFSGKVLIIGAGAAGLTAGYILKRHHIDFEILEASSIYGGRVKGIKDFVDFPIDLGAEWIHDRPDILSRIISNGEVEGNVELINYSPEELYVWRDGDLKKRNLFTNFYGEYKFKNSGWFDFFETFIVPSVRDQIVLNSPILEIDYSSDKVHLTNTTGDTFEGDRVIVTVPLNMLRNNSIQFIPEYPAKKVNALENVPMPDGIKVFIEFKEKFFPDILAFGTLIDFVNDSEGERIYYDAAFRKDTDRHVLGLFSVGPEATTYTEIKTDSQLIEYILDELDEIFDGQARQHYIQHVVQNWSKEPYIMGSYSHYDNDGDKEILTEPIDDLVYFAGEAYAPEAYSTVHGACESAYVAVEQILAG
jgi:monoamine oxidase